MPLNHLILCHPFLLLPSVFPSIRVFSNESVLRMRWPKYWSFSFNTIPSNEHPRLIYFRMDWVDLLAVQGTLKSLLQHHSSKASIHWHSAFYIFQISHPCMTTGKTIALTRWMFLAKQCLCFLICFLGWSSFSCKKQLSVNFMVAITICSDFGAPEIKPVTVSTVSPSFFHEVMGPDALIFVLQMLSFKPTFSLSSFTFIQRLYSSSSLSAIRVVSSAYLRLLIFLPAILILACASSSPAFLMMYSAYKLNKQGDNIQP